MYTKNVRIRGKSVKALTLDPSGIPGKFLWVRLDIPLTEVSFAIEMDNIYERPLGKPNIVKIGLIDEPQPVINLYPKGLFVSPIKKADAGVWKTYRFEYFPADNGMVDCHMYYGGMEIARIRRPRPDTLKRIFLVKNTLVSLANIRIIPLKMQSE